MSDAILIVATAIVVTGVVLHILARRGDQQTLGGFIVMVGIVVATVGLFMKAVGI